jgi:trehalose synthase
VFEVETSSTSMDPARFRSVLRPSRREAFEQGIVRARELLAGRVVWNVNSTAPRRRVHLASLPIDDPAENAIIVNALQRHATVITQKSLAEGFGLTVAEAIWKARPVVASRIGGIQSQIIDGETGVLLDDPRDLEAFGEAVTGLLADLERAGRIGERARERVRDEFTSPRSLLDYLRVIENVLERSSVPTAA